MDGLSVGAVAAIAIVFVVVRRIPAFVGGGAAIVCASALATRPPAGDERLAAWVVMNAGLAACVAGLAGVRAMLVRSVSLQLMAHIDGIEGAHFEQRVRSRVDELQLFHLARRRGGLNALTPFGAAVAAAVAMLYRALHITE